MTRMRGSILGFLVLVVADVLLLWMLWSRLDAVGEDFLQGSWRIVSKKPIVVGGLYCAVLAVL
jgi:hypothetical protein